MEDLVHTTKNYYDSSDADTFYHTIWGGEDIHVGLYEATSLIREASRLTVEKMAQIADIRYGQKVLDLGSGYGGSARYLASRFQCDVDAFNLSETENRRNEIKNREQGLTDKIRVIQGNFEQLPFENNTYDVVWSQDAFLHSEQKTKIFQEIKRVLKPGGTLIFTDPMQADDCPENVLEPILQRIHLKEMASPSFYRDLGKQAGLQLKEYIDLSHNLTDHYSHVLKELENKENELQSLISQAYLENMKKGLQHWIVGGSQGHLAWGIFYLEVPGT